jgi:hypothetical protein
LKKLILIAAVLALVFSACSLNNDPQIRFQNFRSNIFSVGVRCGDAIYYGTLAIGATTGYYTTTPGTYPMQYMSIGSWVTVTGGNVTVESGKKYSVIFTDGGASGITGQLVAN